MWTVVNIIYHLMSSLDTCVIGIRMDDQTMVQCPWKGNCLAVEIQSKCNLALLCRVQFRKHSYLHPAVRALMATQHIKNLEYYYIFLSS